MHEKLIREVTRIEAMTEPDLFDAWLESDANTVLYCVGLARLVEWGWSPKELREAYNEETDAIAERQRNDLYQRASRQVFGSLAGWA